MTAIERRAVEVLSRCRLRGRMGARKTLDLLLADPEQELTEYYSRRLWLIVAMHKRQVPDKELQRMVAKVQDKLKG